MKRFVAQSREPIPFRVSLAFVIAAVAIPALAFIAVVLWKYATTEQARLQEKAVNLAKSAALAIDRELAHLSATTSVLSLSPHLQTGDLKAFHARAVELRHRLDVIAVLQDSTGKEIIRADAPFAAPVPKGNDSPPVSQVLEAKQPLVSHLVVSPISKVGMFVVRVPVMKGDEVGYILGLEVPSERIRSVVRSIDAPADWVIAVVDRAGYILGRNIGHERFSGKLATPDLLANTTGEQGTWWGYTQEGTPVLGAYVRTRTTDWRVAVGVARAVLNAPLKNSLWILAGVGLGFVIISVALTAAFGRSIIGAFDLLVDSARRVGEGEVIKCPITSISEVNQIGKQLAEASTSIRARHLADERAAEAGRRIQTILESITDSVFVLDREWRFSYLNSRAKNQIGSERELIGQKIWDAFPEAVGGAMWHAYHEAAKTGRSKHAEQFYEPMGRWFAASAYPSSEGLTVYFRDITDEKRMQEHQELMVRELHHRIRNTLSTVQAIANATARRATDIQSFQQSFRERIASLSRTHTMMVERSWTSLPLRALLESELAPYASGDAKRTQLIGPDLEVSSSVALSLGMGFHELTTNAAKHGALSNSTGRVEVSWTVEAMNSAPCFRLNWVEKGGPPVAQPRRIGFGSQVLNDVLKRQLRAEVQTEFATTGIRVTLKAPLDAVSCNGSRQDSQPQPKGITSSP